MKFEVQVSPEIFDKEPTFRRGLVIATFVNNTTCVDALERLLHDAVEERRAAAIDLSAEAIMKWDEAHRRFGNNPNRFPPSHKAHLKRLQRPQSALPYINSAVAIMNTVSIRHALPVGGDDLAEASKHGDVLALRGARGDERFIPLGEPQSVEHPGPGEVVYVVGSQVMCRRWNWRNGHLTRVTEGTQMLVMNTDDLGHESEARVIAARDEVSRLLRDYCSATVRTSLLTAEKPALSVDLA